MAPARFVLATISPRWTAPDSTIASAKLFAITPCTASPPVLKFNCLHNSLQIKRKEATNCVSSRLLLVGPDSTCFDSRFRRTNTNGTQRYPTRQHSYRQRQPRQRPEPQDGPRSRRPRPPRHPFGDGRD